VCASQEILNAELRVAGLPAEQTLLSILLMAGKVFPSEKHTYKGHEGEHGAKVRSLSHELCVDPDSAVPTRLKCIPDHVAEVTGVLKGLPRDWYKNPVKQYPLLGEAVVETAAAGEVSAEDEEEDEDEDEGQEEDEQGDKEGDKEEGGEEEEDEEGLGVGLGLVACSHKTFEPGRLFASR